MSQIIELGAFSPDIAEVVRQLRQDLKDDWYPDSLNYEDALKTDVAAASLADNFERNHGIFVPEDRTELSIPKQGFVTRYSLEVSLPDRLYYQALVGQLIPYYDPLLPNQVLNHRYVVEGYRARNYLFKHPIEQWRLFNAYVSQEARQNPVILVTDIQNYYENINVEQLIEVFEENLPQVKAQGAEKARLRRLLGELRRCLPVWCYKHTHGLPQNRDASSFLANFVMLQVDRAMLDQGYVYYRYMDDIRVAVKTQFEARNALQCLIAQLRRIGLNVNSAKNKILEPGNPGYAEAIGRPEPLLEQIDDMWSSRSPAVIRRSFEYLQKLAKDLIARKATQDRAFRFCVNKFVSLALCPEFAIPKAYFDPMTDICIQELDAQPFSSDNLVRLLKAVPTSPDQMAEVADLIQDPQRSIYDWQNYLLWQLMVYKKFDDPDLLAVARNRSVSRDRPADRAGAILYLGAMGSGDDRQLISKSFKSCEQYLVQRNALIAVHEVKFHLGIKEHVKNHVLPSLMGTYKRLHDGYFGQYHRPLASIPAVQLYDEVASYD